MSENHSSDSAFAITVLRPRRYAMPELVSSWVADGVGVLEALERPLEEGTVLAIDRVGWGGEFGDDSTDDSHFEHPNT